MAITKIEMWLSIAGIILIFSLSMLIAGNDLDKSGVKLDERSKEYIQEYKNIIKDNSLEEFTTNTTLQEKKKNPLVDFATNLPLVSDVLGAVNFFIDKTKIVFNFIAVIYNFPTFFLQGFGLTVGNFSDIINVITTLLLVAITIMAVRIVK